MKREFSKKVFPYFWRRDIPIKWFLNEKNIIYIMFNSSLEKGEKGKEEGKGKRKEKYIFLCCVRKNISFHIKYDFVSNVLLHVFNAIDALDIKLFPSHLSSLKK